MIGRVRVLIHAVTDDPGEIARAYHRISAELAGTPGLLGNELLRCLDDPRRFAVLSEWQSLPAFHTWESGPGHRAATAPLRPYQDESRGFVRYTVEAAYPSTGG